MSEDGVLDRDGGNGDDGVQGLPIPVETRREPVAYDDGTYEVTDANGELLRVTGALLTEEGGGVATTRDVRELCALFDDGLFLVSKSHAAHPLVSSIAAKAKLQGHPIRARHEVDLSTLRLVYNRHLMRPAAGKETQRPAIDTRMQREFADLVNYAAQLGASDIHVTVAEGGGVIRVRVDGSLEQHREIQESYGHELCATAYNMAQTADGAYQPLNIQEARVVNTAGRFIDRVLSLRLHYNPLAFGGRHLACRLLYRNTDHGKADLDKLGYARSQLALIRLVRTRPYGLAVISGPTGSGKSTTLQRTITAQMIERRDQVNVVTLEDPPEYLIATQGSSAIQIPVTNAKTQDERRQKFHEGINAQLRSDPDIIMIGEIRDAELAQMAFEAAMTGHPTWTSLHANTALQVIERLRDLKVEPFKLFNPELVIGLIGQRLVRKLCPSCRVSAEDSVRLGNLTRGTLSRARELLATIGSGHGLWGPGEGCRNCRHQGHVGRTVVSEVVVPDEGLMQLLERGQRGKAREYWLETLEGYDMMTLGVAKMLKGEIDPMELEARIGLIEPDPRHARALQIMREL